jgi:hypothetical protein
VITNVNSFFMKSPLWKGKVFEPYSPLQPKQQVKVSLSGLFALISLRDMGIQESGVRSQPCHRLLRIEKSVTLGIAKITPRGLADGE